MVLFLLDINECEDGTHDCDVNADCTNTRGSFSCTCKIGYEADGDDCRGENVQLNLSLPLAAVFFFVKFY